MKSAKPMQTSSLFKISTEVGITNAEFSKHTLVPKKYVKLTNGLSASNLPCTVNFKQKSANPLPTMNSAPEILKSAFGSPTSTLPYTDKNKYEVGIPSVDYEQCY